MAFSGGAKQSSRAKNNRSEGCSWSFGSPLQVPRPVLLEAKTPGSWYRQTPRQRHCPCLSKVCLFGLLVSVQFPCNALTYSPRVAVVVVSDVVMFDILFHLFLNSFSLCWRFARLSRSLGHETCALGPFWSIDTIGLQQSWGKMLHQLSPNTWSN